MRLQNDEVRKKGNSNLEQKSKTVSNFQNYKRKNTS